MSSHPEIAPWAPAAAAIGPGRHSEEARSPQPKDLIPTPPQCLGFSKRLSQLLFPFRRLGERGAVVRERRDPRGRSRGGGRRGRPRPPTGLCFCPYKVWDAVGEGPGPRLRPVPPSLLSVRAAGTSQCRWVLLACHPCAQSSQPALFARSTPPARRPVPHRSHGRHQEEDADAKTGQGECHRPRRAGRGRQEAS